ncbi:DOCK family protein [Heterostelium album PN500]|uniref:DOCK family protein n=1 Tax=Heterostelium pallidum (strain ATCC 26659 / Pp 5 / PN500) TaxID=670386 RepID=D3B386_HETP5|nr:DOCK family protein [Heterostelium album PN500]EFA83784.1 DOCK family protein [Heterostelium album PN500]|eukprot:XP_020435901.1 DOCK family protein [Heterostelium album PN500]
MSSSEQTPDFLSVAGSSSTLDGSPIPSPRSHAGSLSPHPSPDMKPMASFLSIHHKDDADTPQLPLRMTWNDFEVEYERERDSLPAALTFPVGEVIVRRIERFPRYIFPPTVGLVMGGLEQHVRDMIQHFYKDYLIVQHKSNLGSSGSGVGGSLGVRKPSATKSQSSISIATHDLNGSQPQLRSHLFSSGKSINKQLSNRRLPLSDSGDDVINNNTPMSPMSPMSPSIQINTPLSPNINSTQSSPNILSTNNIDPLKQLIPERFGLELLCEVKELKFLQEIEPFFCSLYIVDLEKRERISENFNFHLNSKGLLESLKISDDLNNGWANQKQALFSLNKYHPNMYFILRVYHIFRGDIEKDIKPYIKDYKKQNKQNVITQFKSEIVEKCTNWGSTEQSQILQPFAWAAYPVFHRPTLSNSSSSANLLQYLQQQQQQNNNNSNSTPTLSSQTLSPNNNNPVQLNSSSNSNPSSTPPSPNPNGYSPPLVPSIPLNLNNGTGSVKARSFTPPINNQVPLPPPLPGSPGGVANGGGTVSSGGHNKTNIEIVGMVPCTPNLSDRSICELLNNDKDLKKLKTVQASFTMSIRSLDADDECRGRISPSLIPMLPLSSERDSFIRDIQDFTETPYPFVDYVNNLYIYPETVFIKYKNPNLQIQVQLIEDLGCLKALRYANLSQFFKHLSGTHDSIGKTFEVVKGIQKIDRLSCVQFFPSILDQLFQIMCSSANDVASQAFSSILHVIKIVDGYEKKAGTEKSRLLTYYSEYMFDYVPDSKNVYEELCRQWVNAINTGIYVKDFRLNWFLFDIMTKSMALSLANSGQLESDIGRENRFKIEFQENLNRLVLKLLPQSDSNGMSVQSWEFFTKFPNFINNLFPLIDRGFLFNLVSRIVTTFTDDKDKDKDTIAMITIKFNFLRIISDYDHYIPLNFPLPIKVVDSIADLTTKFFKRHFIAVLLLNEVEACLKQNKSSIRNQAIQTLKQLLKKHHFDPRYQQQEIREKIATIYFPFVLMMVEHYSILKHSLDSVEVPDWLTCFIWVLQYCNRDLLRVWFTKETETRQNSFLSLILLSLETFKDEPSIHEIILLDIEICKIILDDFKSIDDKLFNMVINNIQRALSLSASDIVPEVYKLIRDSLIPKHPQHLFENTNNICEILCYELLCAADSPKLSVEAASLFYFLLEQNFARTTNDILRMKIQSTVAISKLVGELKLENSSNIIVFMNKVKELMKTHPSSVFKSQIEEVINRINTLIKYSNTINANRTDIEMVAEMYYNISNSYFESPNLRVTWLENLSKKNCDNGQFDEGAQCLIQSAYLISCYLTQKSKLHIRQSDFIAICPNIPKELELPPLKDESLFQTWTLEYMVELLENAISLTLKANRYELAIEIYSLISKIYKSKKDYKSLISVLSNQKVVCETLIEKTKEIRFQPKYYRISFQGAKFEELDGKEYIYKKPADCLLKHIQTQIREHLFEKFGKSDESVVLLPNTPFDRASLDNDKLYFQIITVEPYIELSQLQLPAADPLANGSQFDQYFGVSQFISETAYSHEGKAIQEDLSKQLKKKTIFSVDPASFPYLKNRIDVTSKREIILSPIENAIELIKGRIVKLIEQLQTPSPRINLLQQVIQGSVFPMVNEGPLKICEVFLSKSNSSQYNSEHVDQLKKAMERFIHYCGWTIKLNKGLISPQHQDFQNMVEKQFELYPGNITTFPKSETHVFEGQYNSIITGSSFIGNVANEEGSGGAIYLSLGLVTNSQFKSNTAGLGGAIYNEIVSDEGTVTCLVNETLTSCQSYNNVDQVCGTIVQCINYQAEIVQDNPLITTTIIVLADDVSQDCPGNVTTFPQSETHIFIGQNNTEYICFESFITVDLQINTNIIFARFNLSSFGINGNQYGGLISITYEGAGVGPFVIFDNVTVGNSKTSGDGGCVYVDGASLSIINSTFSGCQSGSYGGAVSTGENTQFISIVNSSFSSNNAALGGAIYSYNQLMATECTFTMNSALTGGAIASNTVNIFGSTFIENVAKLDGGAVYAIGNDNTIEFSGFFGNVVNEEGSGGALYIAMGSVTNSQFKLNSAGSGGAIYSENGELVVANSTFSTCRALDYGGAILSGGSLNVDNCTFVNQLSFYGGAITIGNTNTNIEITNSIFFANQATNGGAIVTSMEAGAIYFTSAYSKLTGGKFIYNKNELYAKSNTFNIDAIPASLQIVNVSTSLIMDQVIYNVPIVIDETMEYPLAYGVFGHPCIDGIATISLDGYVEDCQYFNN